MLAPSTVSTPLGPPPLHSTTAVVYYLQEEVAMECMCRVPSVLVMKDAAILAWANTCIVRMTEAKAASAAATVVPPTTRSYVLMLPLELVLL